MRRTLTGERGLAPTVLVIIIVWALVAVLLLTGTLLTARRIDKDVVIIRPEVSHIGRNTALIRLAGKTAKISASIKKAAVPLTGQLDQTLKAAKSIDLRARDILVTARAINETAGSINSNARAINVTVKSINGTVSSIGNNIDTIHSSVKAINSNARSINASARSILSNAGSINSSVRSIRSRGSTILATVGSIDPQVAGINKRARAIIGVGRGLRSDLDRVLADVGTSNAGRTILAHANSIDCSALLRVTGLPTNLTVLPALNTLLTTILKAPRASTQACNQ